MKQIQNYLAIFTFAAAIANAQGPPPGGPGGPPPEDGGGRKPRRELPPELIKKFDKNGDGKLDDEEMKAFKEDRKAKAEERRKADLEKYDTDKDGKLSPEEGKAMQEARHKENLEKYDSDKDGKLSPDEVKAANDARAKEGLPPLRGPGGQRGPRPPKDAPEPAPAN